MLLKCKQAKTFSRDGHTMIDIDGLDEISLIVYLLARNTHLMPDIVKEMSAGLKNQIHACIQNEKLNSVNMEDWQL